jgi:hypothetical protein
MPTEKPRQDDSSDEDQGATDLVNPVPDEDGPHDVPDDKVIEKTLPSKGSVGSDGRAS